MNLNPNFSKVKKCDQVWEELDQSERGRICGKCTEVMHDFRGKTNWEIALIHANSETKVCGIYDQHAFDTSQHESKTLVKRKAMLLASTLSLITAGTINSRSIHISSKNNQAQTQQSPINTKTTIDKNESSNEDSIDDFRFVKGVIVNEESEPLIGVNIVIKDSNNGTITDIDGSYTIDVTAAIANQDSVTLIYSYTGYGRSEETIFAKDFEEDKEVKVDLVFKFNPEMEVFGIASKLPLYKRVWRGLTNIFRK